MNKVTTFLRCLIAGLALSVSVSAAAQGSPYPDKTIKLVVPFTAGGQFDIVARMLAQFASKSLGQSVIVENIGGGGGNIGAARVRNSAPDGYTLLTLGGNHTIAKSLYAKPGFDVLTDFSPISMISVSPHVILAGTALPVNSFPELVEYAKRNPGTLDYGTPGMGSSMHLTFEMIKSQYGLDPIHVPYRGGAQALADLSANQIKLAIVAVAPAVELIKSGRARPLAVTSKSRTQVLPNVPAFSELGYSSLDTGSWMGLAGPKNMPPEIVARWNSVVRAFLNDPEASAKLDGMAFKKEPTTAAQFQKFILSETEAFGKVIQENKIKAE